MRLFRYLNRRERDLTTEEAVDLAGRLDAYAQRHASSGPLDATSDVEPWGLLFEARRRAAGAATARRSSQPRW